MAMPKKENLSQKAIASLSVLRKEIDRELEKFFLAEQKMASKIDRTAGGALEVIAEFTLRGGKRLRPALTFYGFQCFNKNFSKKELIRVAMSNELLQSGLLIHDDVMDRSDLRRNKATVHRIFEKIGARDFSWKVDFPEKNHFGQSLAICAGDICFSLAEDLILKSQFKHCLSAVACLNQVLKEVTFGQIIDARSSFEKNFSVEDVLKIYQLKSATYTIETPLLVGAILAGAKKEELNRIKKFAFPLGVAFQIQDDILDLFGQSEKTGKEEGKDLKEGKRTLLILKTLEKISPKEKSFLEKKLGQPDLTKEDMEKIKKMIISSGALKYCQEYSEKLILEAKEIIQKQKYLPQGRDFLLGIADYLLEREV